MIYCANDLTYINIILFCYSCIYGKIIKHT